MKTWYRITLLLLLITAGYGVQAQENAVAEKRMPRWVSDKGYWMVESNIHQPREACIYFYNNEGVLVHKETLHGQKLALHKTRTKMKLKQALETVVTAWEAGHPYRSPDASIVALLK